jgi:hypothetical protein
MFNLRDPSLSTGRFSTSATLTREGMFSTYLDQGALGGQGTTQNCEQTTLDRDLVLTTLSQTFPMTLSLNTVDYLELENRLPLYR